MKKIMAMFGAVIITITMFAGCSKLKTWVSPTSDSGPLKFSFGDKKGADITPDALYYANDIDTLLDTYGTIKVTRTEPYSTSVEYYFRKNDRTVSAFKNIDHNGLESFNGSYGAYNFYFENDHYICLDQPGNYIDEKEFLFGTGISELIDDGEISDIKREGDTYTFSTIGLYEENRNSYTVDRKTLALQKCYWKVENSEITVDIAYGEEADDFGILAGWDNPTKTITVVSNFTDKNGKTVKDTFTIKVPADFEYIPQYDYETESYLDAEHTTFYQYPGNGVDYTIYVTNAAE